MTNAEKIFELLEHQPGLTAEEVAQFLGIERFQALGILYGNKEKLRKNQHNKWYWNEEVLRLFNTFAQPTESRRQQNRRNNMPLRTATPWNDAEDNYLRISSKRGASDQDISNNLKRDIEDIIGRKEGLGIALLVPVPKGASVPEGEIPVQKIESAAKIILDQHGPTSDVVGFAQATEIYTARKVNVFVCRYRIPYKCSPHSSIEYASYMSPMGRLVARTPSDDDHYTVSVGGVPVDSYWVHLNNRFTPTHNDVVNNMFSWPGGKIRIRSLKDLQFPSIGDEPAREIQYSVQLPDQPVLDSVQDEIFRAPANSRVLISGAPGTGKTTLLLKRLSQKTKWEFLTDEEKIGLTEDEVNSEHNWILFTPNDLLKGYLKEAMAIELLPASDKNVSVFETFKLAILREIGIIELAGEGSFRRAGENIEHLKERAASNEMVLNNDFEKFYNKFISEFFVDRIKTFQDDTSDASQTLRKIIREIPSKAHSFQEEAENLEEEASRPANKGLQVDDLFSAKGYENKAADLRVLAVSLKRTAVDLRQILQRIESVARTPASQQIWPLSNILQSGAEWRDYFLPSITAVGLTTRAYPSIESAVTSLNNGLRKLIADINWANLFRKISMAFQEFRKTNEFGSKYYKKDRSGIDDKLVTVAEENVLFNNILKFTIEHEPHASKSNLGKIVLAKRRLTVGVDEASDFSSVELACMEKICAPNGGITICGDLMQRMNESGIKNWSAINTSSNRYNTFELKYSYRQSNRLFEIARDLFQHSTGQPSVFESAYSRRAEDPPAISHRTSKENPSEKWLNERIGEICLLSDRKLPTTAILVPTEAEVQSLYERLFPLLRESGIELDAAINSHSIGDSARIRIFPVKEIKGLEFEAVFYVGIDCMASIHKTLIDKYVYVGLSRARSFLGVTFEDEFPEDLACIKHHFQLSKKWRG